MDKEREEIKQGLRLDAAAEISKVSAIPMAITAVAAKLKGYSLWYLALIATIAFIIIYVFKVKYVESRFKNYTTLQGRLVKMSMFAPFRSTRRIKFSYKYQGMDYVATNIVIDVNRKTYNYTTGDKIKIIMSLDDHKQAKIISFDYKQK
ncbi:hypothetical protein [Clostridium thermarum]|uniref:hypothetical protein n=1 Tax=Clostridium thermarum TaxID=1716543 RepID=UPI0013D0B0A2|nr:hypothetical protein [Clostridium thermarum]